MSDANKSSKADLVTLYGLLLFIGSSWRARLLSRGQLVRFLGLPPGTTLWSIRSFYLPIFAGH